MDDFHNQFTVEPVEACEICGNIGFLDCNFLCCKCKLTRQHVKTGFVKNANPAIRYLCQYLPTGTRLRIPIKKPPQNSKVHYISPEEAKVLGSSSSTSHFAFSPPVNKPYESKMEVVPPSNPSPKFRIKPYLPVGPSGSREPLNNWSMPSCIKDEKMAAFTDGPARQHCGENQTAKRVSFGEVPKPGVDRDKTKLGHTPVQLGQRFPAVSSDERPQRFCKRTTSKYLSLGKLYKVDINPDRTSQLLQSFPTGSSGINVGAEAQTQKIDSPNNTVVLDSYLPNHPAMTPTWRGTFKIRNEALPCNIFDEIQAHPPCKVHSKVYKLSKQFPETLEFEMLPQWNTRISIFEDDIPSELDIGLYFLSPRMSDLNRGSKPEITSTVGHEQSYCLLLEYLDKHELLLKTQIDKVELLVFSSKYLPEGSRKIYRKHFLWGILQPC
ncbi:uncharacterized protein [Spinacia oleracea]|uniref:Uncharacterized protein isoform X2 n=1 Tax=Spinacia oleracea TaxID=3562 RepID=A0ABM3QKR2_SPIOL|nr:uncharacterized protein LOC110787278 isoform X2 [Spinacia oleracea]